jgi:two-component system, chemotaxis family, response regulator Rcp1
MIMNKDWAQILLVEDNQGDARLTKEALKDSKIHIELSHVEDGVEAMAFLQKQGKYADVPKPDLVLLDLNLPKMSGREVLEKMRQIPECALIPVVILTTSEAEEDIMKSYELNANCYITKPVDFNEFLKVVNSIDEFWLTIVKLPKKF